MSLDYLKNLAALWFPHVSLRDARSLNRKAKLMAQTVKTVKQIRLKSSASYVLII